jgi:translation initiation factor 1
MRLFAGTEWDQPPTCERCEKLEVDCDCPPTRAAKTLATPASQTVRVAVEKRKRGKLMTVVHGLPAAENDLPGLLTQLKNLCGAGGTVKEDQIEIQGDHQERVRQKLAEIGYRVKT